MSGKVVVAETKSRGVGFFQMRKIMGQLNKSKIFKEWQQKGDFAPIDYNAEAGPLLLIVICSENSDAMNKSLEVSRPASSVYPIT